jgi:putative hemolysin
MRWFIRIVGPAVTVLQLASHGLLSLIGERGGAAQGITEEEVKAVIHEGARAGVLKDLEREMLSGVMRLADRRAELIMTEREHFVTVDLDEDPAVIWQHLRTTVHTRVIAVRGQPARVMGLLETRDVLARVLEGGQVDFERLLVQPPRIPPNMSATALLEGLRDSRTHMLFVVDERDDVIGLITATDILNTIVPGFGARGEDEGAIALRGEGEWLVDGDLLIDVLVDHLGFITLPADRSFDSVAGFVLWHLERLPVEGEQLRADGYLFEVLDMDGPRIDKVLVTRLDATTALDDALDSG